MSAFSDLLQPAGGWLQPMTPRVAPPPPAERGLLFRGVSHAAKLFGRKQLPNVFPVFHVNPRLFWPWLLFASRLMPYGKLPAKTREKLILRTAWNCRSRYEWVQHLQIGLQVHLVDEDFLYVANQVDQPSGGSLDATLMSACDALCAHHPVSDADWAALGEHYAAPALIEITVLVGHYMMVAALLVNTGVEVEPDVEEVLSAFHARVAARLAVVA
ncbi:MAG TPA: carboxymuconolactone decarboxylase family protein [Nevskiaceae bacterium]|nr:carboxymuconolactone decarboxylase family protein [Nevskiaceae bacterium]